MRAIQWIPTQQGLDGYQKSLHPCALDERSLSIVRVNTLSHHFPHLVINKWGCAPPYYLQHEADLK